jgi:hypothetical protein
LVEGFGEARGGDEQVVVISARAATSRLPLAA